MRKLLVVISMLVLCTFASTGCAVRAASSSVELSCDELAETQHITQEVQVAAGESLTVRLCSNPTTGFQWEEAKIGDTAILKETDHQFIAAGDSASAPRLGAAGQEMWTFEALKPGSTILALAYSRPWEDGEKAVWIVELTVTVK